MRDHAKLREELQMGDARPYTDTMSDDWPVGLNLKQIEQLDIVFFEAMKEDP
jgi:hypothetical protein